MLKKLAKKNMGTSNLGWLESRFHFSFAQYHNPKNMNFGVLRVLNDDIIHPHSGFGTHPHKDMEIITYVIKGAITHKDSMGNFESLSRGEIQYMSAGDGITHSEYNTTDEDLRLLQLWIVPPKKSLPKLYGSHRFKEDERKNKLLHVVSSMQGDAKIKIHQDVDIFVSDTTQDISYEIEEGKQVYFVQIEGASTVNETVLNDGDAIEITEEKALHVKPLDNSHFLFVVMDI
jgi:hypothetical protein